MKIKSAFTMRDFDFARLMNGIYEEDITEWFSDNDVYIADIILGHSGIPTHEARVFNK